MSTTSRGGETEEQASTQPRTIYDPVADTPEYYLRDGPEAHPPLDYPPYKSTARRHPRQPLIYLPHTITEITGPQLGDARILGEHDDDLTVQHEGEPIGERITVMGRVFDTEGKPLRGTLVEVWQANAAGRYKHRWDRWPAPLDPNFSGAGRCVTDDQGRYRFLTIKPYDPIFNSVADPRARERMISSFSIHDTVPNWAAAYQFDLYLRGPAATPFEEDR
jgi:protocatechuate 3,4-dioxygenase beta subunit